MHAENRRYWLKTGSYSLLINIQSVVFGLGSFYLLVHLLSKHEYGIWTLFIVTTTIFDMVRNGLIQNALIKYLSASATEEHRDIISASFVLSGLLMVACIAINLGLAHYLANIWHDEGLVNMFYVYTIVYIFQGLLAQFQWIEQANLSFKGVLITTTIKQGGFFLYIAACFLFHLKISLISLIYAQAASALLGAVVEYWFIKTHLSFRPRMHKAWVKKLFDYGKYVFGTSIGSVLTGTVNQMMLGAFLSADAAGAFNVAMKIMNLTEIPTTAMGSIVFPQNAKRFAENGKDASKYLYEKSVGAILALIIPSLLFLFFFAGTVVHILAGGNYPETIPVVRFTVITCLFTPFSRLFGTILDSIGKFKLNFVIIILLAIVELLFNYLLIPRYGIMGAVYATLLAVVIFFVIMQWILRKELNVRLSQVFIQAIRFYPEFFNDYAKPIFRKIGFVKK